MIKAKGKFHGRDGDVEATVINPGAWFGNVWLISVEDCFDPPLYAVEADCPGDAVDEFVDSGADESVRIKPDSPEADGYGWDMNDGSWLTTSGRRVTDPEKIANLSELSVTGLGINYDGESIMVFGQEGCDLPWPCLYFGEDLPACGVDPRNYAKLSTCADCGQEFFPNTNGACGNYCRPCLMIDVLREFVDDINSTGGLMFSPECRAHAPVADPRWSALAATYYRACILLGLEPQYETEPDNQQE